MWYWRSTSPTAATCSKMAASPCTVARPTCAGIRPSARRTWVSNPLLAAGGRDALDDVALEEKHQEHHRKRGEDRADQHPVRICYVLSREAGDPQGQGEQGRIVEDDERPEEVVPLALEAEDGERGQRRGGEWQDHSREYRPFAG